MFNKFFFGVLFVNILAIFLALLFGETSKYYFEEHRFITFLSFFQLLGISFLSWKIFSIRKKSFKTDNFINPSFIWFLVSLGFLYLALDEYFCIHEAFGRGIRWLFSLEKVGLMARIDDIIIGIYGLVGIFSFYLYRQELKKYKNMFWFVAVGFILLFFSVALDILTHSQDILSIFIKEVAFRENVFQWLSAFEEIFKIIAEGVFLGVFYNCFIESKKNA